MAQVAVKRQSAKPAIRETRLFINNQWVEPGQGGTFDTYNPATGEVIAKVAAASAADVDRAVKAAREALETGPWSRMDAAERGRLMFKLADLIEQNAEELATLESLNCGKTIRDSRGDMQGVVQHAALLRRLGRQDRRPHRAGARQLPVLHAPSAGGRGGPDHPVELPAADAGVEVGPGPGVRQHGRHEAGRANAADRPPRRRTGPRSRLPARRHQHPQRLRRNHRRRPGGASGRGQDRLHRPRRYGQDHPEGRRRHAEADHVRAGRQEPQRHLRRLRHGAGRRRRVPRHLLPRRAMLHGRQPACSSRRRSTRSSSNGWRRRRRNASSAIRSTRRPSRARRCRRSRWTRSSATSTWARSRAPSC